MKTMTFLLLFGSKSDSAHAHSLEQALAPHTCRTHYLSAHRHPDQLLALLKKQTDVDAIFAGAGLAAHLPGVVCSKTMLPVFGYPLPGALSGLDALLSILQMPSGLPVGTVGINGAPMFGRFIQSWKTHSCVELVFKDVTTEQEQKLREKCKKWIDNSKDMFLICQTGSQYNMYVEVFTGLQNRVRFCIGLYQIFDLFA